MYVLPVANDCEDVVGKSLESIFLYFKGSVRQTPEILVQSELWSAVADELFSQLYCPFTGYRKCAAIISNYAPLISKNKNFIKLNMVKRKNFNLKKI